MIRADRVAKGLPALEPREEESQARRIVKGTQFAKALGEVMNETDTRKLATVSPIMFERIGQMAQSGVNLDPLIKQARDAAAAGGAGAARASTLANELTERKKLLLEPSVRFRKMAEDLIKTGNEYQISQIMGGPEATSMIDMALEHTGDGKGIVEMMQVAKGRGAPSSPGVLKVIHEQAYNTAVPQAATIAPRAGPATTAGAGPPANPNREAYKSRLMSDPETAQALAHGLAYDVSPTDRSAQLSLLREIRDTIATRGPDESRKFNAILDQVQQAYSQRIKATSQAVASRGRDPIAASRAAQARLAPEIAEIEDLRTPPSPPPTGTP